MTLHLPAGTRILIIIIIINLSTSVVGTPKLLSNGYRGPFLEDKAAGAWNLSSPEIRNT